MMLWSQQTIPEVAGNHVIRTLAVPVLQDGRSRGEDLVPVWRLVVFHYLVLELAGVAEAVGAGGGPSAVSQLRDNFVRLLSQNFRSQFQSHLL